MNFYCAEKSSYSWLSLILLNRFISLTVDVIEIRRYYLKSQ